MLTKSALRASRGALLIAAIAIAPVACARNDVPAGLEPGQEASAPQRESEGPPIVALVAIGAALMLLLVVFAIEEGGAGLVTPPPPGS